MDYSSRPFIFFVHRSMYLFLYFTVIISLGLVGIAAAMEDAGQVHNVSHVDVLPSGYLPSGTPVTAAFTINVVGQYPAGGEEQLVTDLDNPNWTSTIVVNGVENLRPVLGGSSLTILGFELFYKTTDQVSARITLNGDAPQRDTPLTNFTIVKIQSIDGNNNVVPGSVVLVEGQTTGTNPPVTNATTPTGVFRPSNGNWYLGYNQNGVVDTSFHFGTSGDIPVVGDWNNDDVFDYGVFRPSNGNWYLETTKTGVVETAFHFGTAGDIPVVGDWNGNGVSDAGVFRPSNGNWYLETSKTGVVDTTFHFGTSGDIPVVGNWASDAMAGEGKIAFVSFRDGNQEIYVMNPDGSGETRLTNNAASDLYPAWSRDGSKIAFSSARDGNDNIFVMNSDGTEQTRLTRRFEFHPTWSPDGSKIAFASLQQNNWNIYVMNTDGSGQIRLTDPPASDENPEWSPDGSKIAFESNREGNPGIYAINPDGSGETLLVSDMVQPSWSPDGSKIAFASNPDSSIYVMNADGSGQTRLANNSALNQFPTWSPDGTKIAFASSLDGSEYQIYVMNADGSGQTRLTSNTAYNGLPDWGIIPVSGDEIGVFRPSNGNWYFDYDKTGVIDKTLHFGKSGDIPLVGDWDGDCVSDVGIFRPSNGNWYLDTTKTGIVNKSFHFGTAGDSPLADSGTTIIGLPTLEKIVPDEGTAGTQILVTALTGTNFQPGASVTLMMVYNPNITANNVKVESPFLITCTFNPPLNASGGVWDIVLTNPDGHFVKGSGMFSVHPAVQPTIIPPISHGITAISPVFTNSSNVQITIFGTDFRPDSTVNLTKSTGPIHSINARNVRWDSSSQVTSWFTIPMGSNGIWNIFVINPDGTSHYLQNGFEIRLGS
jgi:hypothetical protein